MLRWWIAQQFQHRHARSCFRPSKVSEVGAAGNNESVIAERNVGFK